MAESGKHTNVVDNTVSKQKLIDDLQSWLMIYQTQFTQPEQFFLDFIDQFIDQVMSMCPNTQFPTDQNQYDKLLEMYQDIIAARIGEYVVFSGIAWTDIEQSALNVERETLQKTLVNISHAKPANLKELHKGYVYKLF